MPDTPIAYGTDKQYAHFCNARRHVLAAWRDWLHTNPSPHDATAELDSMRSALEQIHAIITPGNFK